MNEFEERFDLFPSRTVPYRPLGFVPLDVPDRFQFGEMDMIQFDTPLRCLVRIETGVVDRVSFPGGHFLVEFEEQPTAI
ncbi:hypothetical protein K6T50_06455 [Halobaculum magnesiiphilum]|uniref:Uncharacterized protein n=1 Tax=Halobaculum magnesiiphilum TaxID=1017351 RepID=A0A8T8WG94_9EURY|nr:hypothetical protein [Halobaculum magnesiiphilum]QZP38773.1 hypothetical protein K6T50_06455 [Halobaculum magnesiiphilum]